MVRGLRVAVVVVVALVSLAGCGGGGSSDGNVDVRLTDYDVILSSSSVNAGVVVFAIDNTGGFVHEILLVRSALAINTLPKTPDGRFDEQGAGVTIVGSARDILAGGTSTIREKLGAGGYYLICNRPAEAGDTLSHFAHGMFAPFTVT